MLKRLCDFCGKPARERTDVLFEHNGESFRAAVLKIQMANGVRWREADTCPRCLKKYLRQGLTSKKKGKPMRKWKMPAWMERYRRLIVNTGRNPVEELMNDDGTNSNLQNNAVRALLCVAVKSQVSLLEQLHDSDLLVKLK